MQIYSNNSEVASLHPNQTSFTLTQLTPGTLYLISVGAFTDAGEGEREERMITMDGSTATPTGMAHLGCRYYQYDAVVRGIDSVVYEITILTSHWSLPHSLAWYINHVCTEAATSSDLTTAVTAPVVIIGIFIFLVAMSVEAAVVW